MEDPNLKFELNVIPTLGFINFELHIDNVSEFDYFFESATLHLDNGIYTDDQEFSVYCNEFIPQTLPPYHLVAKDNLLLSVQVAKAVKQLLKKRYMQNKDCEISMHVMYGRDEADLGQYRKSGEISVKQLIDKIEAM